MWGMLLIGEHIRDEFIYYGPNLTFGIFFANPVHMADELWAMLAPVFLPMMLGSIVLRLTMAMPAYFAVRAAALAHQRRRRTRLRARAVP